MESELLRARADRVKVVTLIHGYGSSGKGGRIRTECRKVLDHLSRRKEIKQIIAGEEFRKRTGPGKALLRRFPNLERDFASDFSNPGVTIVVL
jgi:DNA-nicking Smr family endonuclease